MLGADLAWNCIVLRARPEGDERCHWHVEMWPRLTIAASVELGAGVWVNIVDPDVAADELRQTGR